MPFNASVAILHKRQFPGEKCFYINIWGTYEDFSMSGETIKTDMTQRTLTSINGTADNAYSEVQKKQELYELAKNKYSVFLDKKYKFESIMKSSKYADNSSIKAQYNQFILSFSDAEIDVDVRRGSLQNSLSYYSKMSTSAFLTNSILG